MAEPTRTIPGNYLVKLVVLGKVHQEGKGKNAKQNPHAGAIHRGNRNGD